MAQPIADGLTFLLTVGLFVYVYQEIKKLENKTVSEGKKKVKLKHEHEKA